MNCVLTSGIPSETVCSVAAGVCRFLPCLASRIPFLGGLFRTWFVLHQTNVPPPPFPAWSLRAGVSQEMCQHAILSPLLLVSPKCGWAMRKMFCRVACIWLLTQASFLCSQHHQIIQQYMVTLENLLFTAELDPHILAVFQQFCALQA